MSLCGADRGAGVSSGVRTSSAPCAPDRHGRRRPGVLPAGHGGHRRDGRGWFRCLRGCLAHRHRRHGRGQRRRRLGAARACGHGHRLPAVHLGLHLRAQGRDDQPRQPVGQRVRDRTRTGGAQRRRVRDLAAPVPRHGFDRRAAAGHPPRRARGPDDTHGFSREADPLARGRLAPSRHHQRRP
ncbi:hypothetical protein D3C71_1461090 [compost metagenome]